jgi:hypothetical protein
MAGSLRNIALDATLPRTFELHDAGVRYLTAGVREWTALGRPCC